MEGSTAGDPMSDVKWCRKSTRRVSRAVTRCHSAISHSSVGRKLRSAGYSLRANRKRLSTRQSPDRNKQFTQINEVKRKYLGRGSPVISVDTKKRELVGPFKNSGRVWRRTPKDVSTYDFPSDANGVAIPYGVYDVGRDEGFVVVGTSRNTPAFAVNAIRLWWRGDGQQQYPDARELLILADAGGSNGARVNDWKFELSKFATDYDLQIRVAHYPTGASKWNPIEHRLFGPISINWAGEPLVDYDTVCGFIGRTRTASGARCRVRLDGRYWRTQAERATQGTGGKTAPSPRPTGIRAGRLLPLWNYTVRPTSLSR